MDVDITDWTKLGSIVRSARIEAGLTQQELADRAGTARSWIARIEAGHRKAELESILRLLAALNLQMRLHSKGEDDEPETRSTLAGVNQAAQARRRAARDSWAASRGAFTGRSGEREEARP